MATPPASCVVAAAAAVAAAVAAVTVTATCEDAAAKGGAELGPTNSEEWGVPSEARLNEALAGTPVDLSLETSRLIVDGGRLMRAGNLDQAEAKYRQAIEQVALLNPESDAVIVLMSRVGNVCYAQGRWEEAADAYSAVTRGLVHGVGRAVDDDAVIELSIKIAECFSMMGNDKAALAGYLFATERARAKVGGAEAAPPAAGDPDIVAAAENRRALLGLALHSMAGHFERRGDFEAAIEPLTEALAVCRTVAPGRDLRTVHCHSRLAIALASSGERVAAVQHAEDAVRIAQSAGPECRSHIQLATLAVIDSGSPHRRERLEEALAAAGAAGDAGGVAHIEGLMRGLGYL